ncbi:hypothetical protein I6N95_15660 [Vagococcus sp. BWB3-3]|uniref:WxL domain-containing protein n=1 Tax=Vagococcus allomyrinae TaxID=2794353 RepID=A0A940P7E8_9ENTE|nr:hypothetical protein [Vagococcus allomyrinae]MBP1042455.1 hypothetical protein [Vagococcus allomyrinae]
MKKHTKWRKTQSVMTSLVCCSFFSIILFSERMEVRAEEATTESTEQVVEKNDDGLEIKKGPSTRAWVSKKSAKYGSLYYGFDTTGNPNVKLYDSVTGKYIDHIHQGIDSTPNFNIQRATQWTFDESVAWKTGRLQVDTTTITETLTDSGQKRFTGIGVPTYTDTSNKGFSVEVSVEPYLDGILHTYVLRYDGTQPREIRPVKFVDTNLQSDGVPVKSLGPEKGMYIVNGKYRLEYRTNIEKGPTAYNAKHYTSNSYQMFGAFVNKEGGQKNLPLGTTMLQAPWDTAMGFSWEKVTLQKGESMEYRYVVSVKNSEDMTMNLTQTNLNSTDSKNYPGDNIQTDVTIKAPVDSDLTNSRVTITIPDGLENLSNLVVQGKDVAIDDNYDPTTRILTLTYPALAQNTEMKASFKSVIDDSAGRSTITTSGMVTANDKEDFEKVAAYSNDLVVGYKAKTSLTSQVAEPIFNYGETDKVNYTLTYDDPKPAENPAIDSVLTVKAFPKGIIPVANTVKVDNVATTYDFDEQTGTMTIKIPKIAKQMTDISFDIEGTKESTKGEFSLTGQFSSTNAATSISDPLEITYNRSRLTVSYIDVDTNKNVEGTQMVERDVKLNDRYNEKPIEIKGYGYQKANVPTEGVIQADTDVNIIFYYKKLTFKLEQSVKRSEGTDSTQAYLGEKLTYQLKVNSEMTPSTPKIYYDNFTIVTDEMDKSLEKVENYQLVNSANQKVGTVTWDNVTNQLTGKVTPNTVEVTEHLYLQYDAYVKQDVPFGTDVVASGVVQGTLSDGSNVAVINSNKTNLTVTKGELVFTSIPKSISFGKDLKRASYYQDYFLEGMEGSLSVKDSRGNGNSWAVTAKMEKPLTLLTDETAQLDLYYQEANTKQLLSDTKSAKIYGQVTTSTQVISLSDRWEKGKTGLIVSVPTNKAKGGYYHGRVLWTLEDVPGNGN